MSTSLSRVERILETMLGYAKDLPNPQSRVEELLIELKDAIEAGGGGGGEITQLAARIAAVERNVEDVVSVNQAQNEAISQLDNEKADSRDVDEKIADVYTAVGDVENDVREVKQALPNYAMKTTVEELRTTVVQNQTSVESQIKAVSEIIDAVESELPHIKSDVAVNQSSIGLRKKNLLNVPKQTWSSSGLVFVVDDDGVRVDGLASSNVYFNTYYEFKAGNKYILSGCPKGGSSSTFFMGINGQVTSQFDFGNGSAVFAPKEDAIISCVIGVFAGMRMDSILFKPMLRYADIEDDAYEPYVDDLQTQITQNRAVVVDVLSSGSKNYINTNNIKDHTTSYGINVKNNLDGSLTISGIGPTVETVLIGNINYGIYGVAGQITGNLLNDAGIYTCDIGLADTRINMQVCGSTNGASLDKTFGGTSVSANGRSFDFVYDGDCKNVISRLTIKANADFKTPVTIRPMICKKSIYDFDPSFQPYAMSNIELTQSLNRMRLYELVNQLTTNKINDVVDVGESVLNYEFIIFRLGLSNISLGASYYIMPTFEISVGAIMRIPITHELYMIVQFTSVNTIKVVGTNIPEEQIYYGIRAVYGYHKLVSSNAPITTTLMPLDSREIFVNTTEEDNASDEPDSQTPSSYRRR